MTQTIRRTVTVKEGGLLELRLPQLQTGQTAEVMVSVTTTDAPDGSWRDFAGLGKTNNRHGNDNDSIDHDLADEADGNAFNSLLR